MRKLPGAIAGLILLFLLCSGIFVDILELVTWLFMLQYKTPEISIVGNVIVRCLTFAVSYALVGLIFNAIGWFNGKVMSISYFIISTLLSLLLAYIIMLIETHLLIIGIVLGVVFVGLILLVIIIRVKSNCRNSKENKVKE